MGKQTLGKKLLHSKFFGLLLFTIVLVIIITLIKSSFLSRGNIRQLFITMTIPGIMLVSVAPLLISGGIDLAAASEATLGSMVFAQLLSFFPALPWGVALVLALLVGGVFGLINVFLVNKMHFMSFIATIGMSSVYSGFATMWTRTNNVQINRTSFLALGKAAILWDWVPWLFVISVALVLVYGYILSSTPFGRSVYMVGGNPYAARLAGLKPKKIQAYLFINSSVMAVLAGIAWSA
jgi:ribose transport system permease protein